MVSDADELCAVAETLSAASVVAVDLEADSMYHFREKVCLVQMADRSGSYVIDPLAVTDFNPLKALFARVDICKVFHGADYDVRSLFRDFGISIQNLFDTQIAATFLGYAETGLESILRRCFDVHLDKKYQKKDWSRRPLPDEMTAYAARDVLHLIPLAERLRRELAAKGRLAWVDEECDLLRRVRPAEPDDGPLFMRFKGAGRLDRRSLAVLESLLQLRCAVAEKKDRPLFKIFGSASLMQLAQTKPATPEELVACGALSAKQIQIYGAAVLEAIDAALGIATSRLPRYPRRTVPSVGPMVPERVRALRTWRDKEAHKLGLDPAVLFNKAQLFAIAQGCPQRLKDFESLPDIRRWQIDSYGKKLLGVLRKAG